MRKVIFAWWPVRLVRLTPDGSLLQLLGWVWLQRVVVNRNVHYGWVAFVDEQDPEALKQIACPYCNMVLPDDLWKGE